MYFVSQYFHPELCNQLTALYNYIFHYLHKYDESCIILNVLCITVSGNLPRAMQQANSSEYIFHFLQFFSCHVIYCQIINMIVLCITNWT